MTTRPWSERQRAALRDLRSLIALRARREAEIADTYQHQTEANDQSYRDSKQQIEQFLTQAQADVLVRGSQAGHDVQSHYEAQRETILQEYRAAKHQVQREYETGKEQIKAEFEEGRWTTNTVYEADRKVARDQLNEKQRSCRALVDRLREQRQKGQQICQRLDFLGPLPATPHDSAAPAAEVWRALQTCADSAEHDLTALESLGALRSLRGARPWLLIGLVWALVTVPGLLLPIWYFWLPATLLIPVAGWLIIRQFRGRALATLVRHWQALDAAARRSEPLQKVCLEEARATHRSRRAQSKGRARDLLAEMAARSREQVTVLRGARDAKLETLAQECKHNLAEAERKRIDEKQAVDANFGKEQTDVQSRHDHELADARRSLVKTREDLSRRHAEEWADLLRRWSEGSQSFSAVHHETTRGAAAAFPAWDEPFRAAGSIPLGLPFGRLKFSIEALPGGQPKDPQLPRIDLGPLPIPALLPFPEKASLLLKASDEGKAAALSLLQALLLRCWLALPPGKVRCTIIDPVGRGENFSAFMHLADHDENLIHGRIWTETAHIEQRLEDLTAHMENVLQKYLRNQLQTLAEYNAQAGEVAEPFRFLVVADFPVNFSDDAARRLLSLASAGARCGIYTFVLLDTQQPFPQAIGRSDLERACTCLTWNRDHFVWDDDDYRDIPLEPDVPPEPARCTDLLREAGEAAQKASKVEVPFESIVPPRERWWTRDSRDGIRVPLGRAGARALQELQLGAGTSQHALIAGKTGSGKSTLLHVLITQLALHYSPREVELYLIDFKKGVEFKSYAACGLPHARVVAVESEREFGLSVLQRLDVELTRRGELYRQAGATDVRSYREAAAHGNGSAAPLPRIMLIVDEFQEFFVEDDKTAQESALLMDRLVRQGRAFGVHVILGSQTLGGAYSLARSTIDQMAVRIALQCSEADAHLILGRENTEAKLLSRPGEAIYNASHGLLEANRLFQIVWLADSRRDELLRELHAKAGTVEGSRAPLVFEGNAAADLARNPPLQRLLHGESPGSAPWQAWLGEAIAIKDPTAAVFRRQSGANLLIVGQHEETAFRLLTSTLVSLAAHAGPAAEPPISLVLASPLDAAGDALLPILTESSAVRNVLPRDLPTLLATLAGEAERRNTSGAKAPQFLCLFGLQRLRDLRRPEDDFGFSRKGDDKPNPYRLFVNLLKDGPPVGIHVVAWCDTLTNLQRSLERQTLREFDLRVLLQMSAADSSTLIDSPLAAKLGPQRAFFFTEEQGRVEKFRPYALPSPEVVRTLLRGAAPVAG